MGSNMAVVFGYAVSILLLFCHVGVHASNETNHHQWRLFEYGDQSNPLYLGDSTEELLQLCLTVDGKDATECSQIDTSRPCIPQCSSQRLASLNRAKNKVRGLIERMTNAGKSIIEWILWCICLTGGVYLMAKGHYRWQNVPIIGNWLMDDPTTGVTFRHYLWMRWTLLGNSNIRWKTTSAKNKDVVLRSKVHWKRPHTPENEREREYRDEDLPPWTIDDILLQKGIHPYDPKRTYNVVEEQRTSLKSDQEMDALYQEVLEEYWTRVYVWPKQRYYADTESNRSYPRKSDDAALDDEDQ